MNTQPLPTVRVFAPEQWGEVDRFANFYGGTFKFSGTEKRAVAGVRNHFQKAITLQTLAVKLKPGLDIDKKQLEERGYTPALNSHELSAVIEAAILELYSSLDCTVKVLHAVYGHGSRSFPGSTRRLFQNLEKVTGSFPDELRLRSLAQYGVARRRHSPSVPPSFHSGVAITALRSGAFLTGLATADWPRLRCGTDALFLFGR